MRKIIKELLKKKLNEHHIIDIIDSFICKTEYVILNYNMKRIKDNQRLTFVKREWRNKICKITYLFN